MLSPDAVTFTVSPSIAIEACAAMSILYVAILYAPLFLLRPPNSFHEYMLRRFACAAVASTLSLFLASFILGIRRFSDLSNVLEVFGIRFDTYTGRAVVIPVLLTSLVYGGSIASKLIFVITTLRRGDQQYCMSKFREWIYGILCDVMVWRNYVVAPFTEELVFRACMIPLLLCGGFEIYNIVFFSPVFFSLAHLNHFLELYYQQNYPLIKAFLIIGLQLGYTVIFGWYAAFLFIRTGHIISPIVAHILCNVMGLPAFSSPGSKGLATIAFVSGTSCFFWLLFKASSPNLYNDNMDGCLCWQGYCK